MKKISFPEIGWYSRGSKVTLSHWDGQNWTGEIKLISESPTVVVDIVSEDKLKLMVLKDSELQVSNFRRTSSITIPLIVGGSALSAFLYYSSRKKP